MKIIVCKCCKAERQVFTGSELKRFRAKKRLTLREVAKALNVSASYINDCENDRRNCSSAMASFWFEKGLV